jgi:hypothetical protein
MNRIGKQPRGRRGQNRGARRDGPIFSGFLRSAFFLDPDDKGDRTPEEVLRCGGTYNLFSLLPPEGREVVKELSLRKWREEDHADLAAPTRFGEGFANRLESEKEGRSRVDSLGR